MRKLLSIFGLLFAGCAFAANSPVPVTKTDGILNGNLTVGNGSTLQASGSGSIIATAVVSGTAVTSIPDGSTNGVTWTITNRTSIPVFNFSLGAIVPTSVAASGAVSGSTGTFSVVIAGDGTSAAPSIVTTNNPTTGFYYHSGSHLGFASNGTAAANFARDTPTGGLNITALGTDRGITLQPSGTGSVVIQGPLASVGAVSGPTGAFDALTAGVTVTSDAGGLKHKRVTTGSIGPGSSLVVTVTWGTTFADANYTVSASVLDTTTAAAALRVVHIESVSAAAVTVRVENTAAGAHTGTVNVIAMHD